jgi:hypothetical protein
VFDTEKCLPTRILVLVIEHFDAALPDFPSPGEQFYFSNDLALERYDNSTPRNGLPQITSSGLRARIQDL